MRDFERNASSCRTARICFSQFYNEIIQLLSLYLGCPKRKAPYHARTRCSIQLQRTTTTTTRLIHILTLQIPHKHVAYTPPLCATLRNTMALRGVWHMYARAHTHTAHAIVFVADGLGSGSVKFYWGQCDEAPLDKRNPTTCTRHTRR